MNIHGMLQITKTECKSYGANHVLYIFPGGISTLMINAIYNYLIYIHFIYIGDRKPQRVSFVSPTGKVGNQVTSYYVLNNQVFVQMVQMSYFFK